MKRLCKEGFKISRQRVRGLMKRLGLKMIQSQAYKVTTQRKHSPIVADNKVNQDFNPTQSHQVWAGDVTYLRTHEGWMSIDFSQ